jgi:RsiW-degrading membrane proteinase PrsW (M82 family)
LLTLIIIALAPVVIILFYVYFRDKYEKEPLGMLFKALALGALTVIPILYVGQLLEMIGLAFMGEIFPGYRAFILAALNEEAFKFIAVLFLVWRSKHFNEKFDGIVYAVFVSLGFAAVENVLYVVSYGTQTGITRAITAVPAHALFGVTMGYYLGLARFNPEKHSSLLFKALLVPVLLHGVYDYILMSNYKFLLILFIPFIIYLWRAGLRKMSSHSNSSRFNPNNWFQEK